MLLLPGESFGCCFCRTAQAATLRYWVEPCGGAGKPVPPGRSRTRRMGPGGLAGGLRRQLTLEKIRRPGSGTDSRVLDRRPRRPIREARPIVVEGQRGAEVYVLPPPANETGRDPLLRDAIVYLTCLHETGHALGLAHTADFDDIMYSFEFGGDIPEYFARYRRKLSRRARTSENTPECRRPTVGVSGVCWVCVCEGASGVSTNRKPSVLPPA